MDCCGYRGDWDHDDDKEWRDDDKNEKCKKKCRHVPKYQCVEACAPPGECNKECKPITGNDKGGKMCVEVCNRKEIDDRDDSTDDGDHDYERGTCYENRQCRLAGLKGECWYVAPMDDCALPEVPWSPSSRETCTILPPHRAPSFARLTAQPRTAWIWIAANPTSLRISPEKPCARKTTSASPPDWTGATAA